MFLCDDQFSVAKLQETWRLALICGSAMLIATVFAGTSGMSTLQWQIAKHIGVRKCLTSVTDRHSFAANCPSDALTMHLLLT